MRGRKSAPFHGGRYRAQNGNMRKFGPTNLHGTAFALQSNGYNKRKLRVWIAQKCKVLVGAETVLTRAGPQTTPFHGVQHRAKNGNMRNFGPTNPHGTVFAPKQWLHQKEDTCMEMAKM